jgi:SAM-dependent methyltransferase
MRPVDLWVTLYWTLIAQELWWYNAPLGGLLSNEERRMFGSFDSPLICPQENLPTLKRYIEGCKDWFHSFAFNDELKTPGRDPSAKKLHHLCLAPSLKGQSVLDVGAYEGYFSFQCEARSADRVVAVDQFAWDWPGSTALPNFEAVHSALRSKVVRVNAPVETLSSNLNGQKFDVVLFLGVLYHAPDMIGYLKNIADVTRGVCVLETYMDALDGPPGAAGFTCEGGIRQHFGSHKGRSNRPPVHCPDIR